MTHPSLSNDDRDVVKQVLGYLNFSSGASDPQFLSGINRIYEILGGGALPPKKVRAGRRPQPPVATETVPLWRQAIGLLEEQLVTLQQESGTFAKVDQAQAVLQLVREHVVPEYGEFHQDLLAHQDLDTMLGPFLLGRFFEAVLQQGAPWTEIDRIARDSIRALNDSLGHRPVPALETRKHEPYAHEWVRPIPVYIRGAGAAVGPYRQLIEQTVALLEGTNPSILRRAQLDPRALAELAIDPRAYDFEHPAHRRPNYQFGEWDPHQIDNQGNYHRFLIRQITLDAIMARVGSVPGIPADQLLAEAAGVLAGTILMASGVSGSGPGAHDSATTLMSLLPVIAQYRDEFYEDLLHQMTPAHADRLVAEARQLRQPFGGARQDLNARLGRSRAAQLERVKLARIFARMGHLDAAREQATMVNVASARMICQIDCGLVGGYQAIDRGALDEAVEITDRVLDLLHRGIACGAIVDPWSILGFDANYSIFPALENTVRDHRVDELVELIERLFDFCARLWSEAAAGDNAAVCQRIASIFESTTNWWHKFAAHEVSAVEASSPVDTFRAAAEVANALQQWHDKGAASGNIAFWAPRVQNFNTPKAYVLVIETLLARHDFSSARSLLVHWLENASRVPLELGDASFHQLALRWLMELTGSGPETVASPDPQDAWPRVRRFFDFVEANANDYWTVPDFDLGSGTRGPGPDVAESEDYLADDQEELDELFGAAYEGVVYKDSTGDGIEGSIYESDESTYDELERERERIESRLSFIRTMARLWTFSAATFAKWFAVGESPEKGTEIVASLENWSGQVRNFSDQLLKLSEGVSRHTLPIPDGSAETLMQYDRQRVAKEMLQESVIATRVDLSEAERFLAAAALAVRADASLAGTAMAAETPQPADTVSDEATAGRAPLASDQRLADITPSEKSVGITLLAATFRGADAEQIDAHFQELQRLLAPRHILYIPLTKSGQPRTIMAARIRQRLIENLLVCLPRVGCLSQTRTLIDTARHMERNFPSGPGAITQFDQLYELGFGEMVEAIVRAAADRNDADVDDDILACLEELTEALLLSWLQHSKTLRLSTLERVRNKDKWQELVDFIQRYGSDLFDQGFLNLSNLRAILHEGVDCWLEQLEEHDQQLDFRLLEDLGQEIARDDAVNYLTIVLEAVVENYHEYNDYNSSTTQSDRGDMLYMLLDFLRLLADYERVMWNLRPIIQAHEILVRRGRNEAAQRWRRALAERIGSEADVYQKKLAALQKKYAMRMVSVASRIGERFLRPMTIDRMRALVETAVNEANTPPPHHAFEILADEAALLIREPTGTGLDIPTWLQALEEEIDQIDQKRELGAFDIRDVLPTHVTPSLDDIFTDMDDWT